MIKTIDSSKIFSQFKDDPIYDPLKKYPAKMIEKIVDFTLDVLPDDSKFWDETQLDCFYLTILQTDDFLEWHNPMEMDYAGKNFSDQFVADTAIFFMAFLAKNRQMKLNTKEFQSYVEKLDKQCTFLDFKKTKFKQKDVFKNNYLPSWQRSDSIQVVLDTSKWMIKFQQDEKYWSKRPKDVDRDFLKICVQALSTAAYDRFRQMPDEWMPAVIKKILTTTFICETELMHEKYELVVPVLSGFLDFVAENGWLNKKTVKVYQKALGESEDEMVDLSEEPENFPFEKRVWFYLYDDLDPNDENAWDNYVYSLQEEHKLELTDADGMNYFGQKLQDEDFVMKGYSDEEKVKKNSTKAPGDYIGVVDFDKSEMPIEKHLDILGNRETLRTVAELVDPDRQKNYFDYPHRSTHGRFRWSMEKAESVHIQGVEIGLTWWLLRDKIRVPKDVDFPELVANVTFFFDDLYNDSLLFVRRWSVRDLKSYVRKNENREDYDYFVQIFRGILSVLRVNGELSYDEVHDYKSVFKRKRKKRS
ncbi:hypothetical protein [Companilactobacillus furfuricola]|uniref:hypothetical protein n=1 Tax=Companilactobacillus furfuricola TaxID=1462575 RepID=UPI000F770E17|nr:hypothetical protein [Companilactobacillus furfuricola]